MPSPPSVDRDGSRTAVLLVVLAVLAASLPATVVTGRVAEVGINTDGIGTAAVGGGVPPTASEVATDRPTCVRDPAPTDAKTTFGRPAALSTPNESEDLTVARGDVAVAPLSVPAGANVTVTVGSGDGYTARLAVRDDGDGRVTLLVNTFLAGNRTTVAPGTYRTRGDDVVTVIGGTPTAPLVAGEYPVSVRQNETLVTERHLTVTEPSVEAVTALRAVPQLFDATNASEIREANRSGLIRPLRQGEYGPEVVSGETLLLRIDAPSFLGVIAAQPGNTTTEKFLALHDDTSPSTHERFKIFGPCGGIRFPYTVAEGGARVLLDYHEGAVYVLLDTDNLEGIAAGGQSVYVEASPESRINDADQELEVVADFRIGERRTAIRPPGADTVDLTAEDRAAIRGETNLLPGSHVSVRTESRVDPTFERWTTATVADDGTFTATVNLSTASNPGLFAVEIGNEQFSGKVGDPPDVYWELNQFGAGERVTEIQIERLDLPNGGFLVAYQYDSATDRFRPIGSATPSDDDLTVELLTERQYLLVVAHRDANGNGAFDGRSIDSPYHVDGRVVSDWFGITIDGVEPSADEPSATFDVGRATTSTTETPTTSPDTTESGPTTSTTSSEYSATTTAFGNHTQDTTDATDADVPGFGPLVTLLVVLGAMVLLRDDRR